ncbi:MAG: LamG domain-containing protein, partial [Methanobacteriota archaeon]
MNSGDHVLGKIGYGLDFDGTDDYVSLPDMGTVESYPFTFECWFKTSSTDNDMTMLYQGDSANGNIRVQLYFSAGKLRWNVKNGNEMEITIDSPNYRDGLWHHAVGVSSSSNMHYFYVDGILKETSSISITAPSVNSASIARWDVMSNYYYNGVIDEPRILKKACSLEWISTEYNNQNQPSTFFTISEEEIFQSSSTYGSPMDMEHNNQWQWSNFTWQNPNIPEETTVSWRIYYEDTSGNVICTNIMNFYIGIPMLFLISGNCFYQNMNPVNNMSVEIMNLNTGEQWQADTDDNHYSLSLIIGADLSAGQTLRFIARDRDESVNVTDYIVTAQDISAGFILRDLTLSVHYRDLKKFPFYLSQVNSGAMVMKQMMDYLMWNNTLYSEPQDVYSEQTLYDLYSGGNHIDANDLAAGLNTEIDDQHQTPPWQYGYFFSPSVYDASQGFETLKTIAIWVDYNLSAYNDVRDVDVPKMGHPYHVPVAIAAGTYDWWMNIRGIHTNRSLWDGHNIISNPVSLYGFWINDPTPGGLGENTYVTADYFINNYFLPLNLPGNPNDGKRVMVTDPPRGIQINPDSSDITITPVITGFASNEAKLIQSAQQRGATPQTNEKANTVIIQKAWDATNKVLQNDVIYGSLFTETTVLGKPVLNKTEYMVTFSHSSGTIFTVYLDQKTGALLWFTIT